MAAARIKEDRTRRIRQHWLPDTALDATAAGLTDVDLLQALKHCISATLGTRANPQ